MISRRVHCYWNTILKLGIQMFKIFPKKTFEFVWAFCVVCWDLGWTSKCNLITRGSFVRDKDWFLPLLLKSLCCWWSMGDKGFPSLLVLIGILIRYSSTFAFKKFLHLGKAHYGSICESRPRIKPKTKVPSPLPRHKRSFRIKEIEFDTTERRKRELIIPSFSFKSDLPSLKPFSRNQCHWFFQSEILILLDGKVKF